MAVDWKEDLREEAADAMAAYTRTLTQWEAEEAERCANLPAGVDRILSVDSDTHWPLEIATAKHLRYPRLLIWDWRVLAEAKACALDGCRVRLELVTPASQATYVKRIERV